MSRSRARAIILTAIHSLLSARPLALRLHDYRPVGPHEGIQEMSLVTRRGSKIEIDELLTVRYVPLVDDV